jgi:hypothetical protein
MIKTEVTLRATSRQPNDKIEIRAARNPQEAAA